MENIILNLKKRKIAIKSYHSGTAIAHIETDDYRNHRVVSRYFFKLKSQKIGPAAHFPATEKKLFFPIPLESRGRLLTATSGGKNMADIECRRGRNYAYFINFVPYFGQLMSVYRHKCLARCLIVTKTSFHAGFWCLSRIKRSTRSPNRKTFGDVCHL